MAQVSIVVSISILLRQLNTEAQNKRSMIGLSLSHIFLYAIDISPTWLCNQNVISLERLNTHIHTHKGP